ncbi:MAG TPA: glucosamine-6-phosphate deaminase [Chitinophagaceae bacterium]|jgi:galactosamine-6-phosphate isomerase|nr:glucosamine-6-phosphate deaminase [Chitinophagaceae bacterium]
MELRIFTDNQQLARQAAADVLDWISGKEKPLLCVASGDSPAAMYRELSRKAKEGAWQPGRAFFAGLDEWWGKNGSDPGSCRQLLDEQLFNHLDLAPGQLCFFDGRAEQPGPELEKMNAFLEQHGPIDVAVVGLGLNGHIGFNEPGVDPTLRTHIIDLEEDTIRTGQKYFPGPQELSKGITMGLATLLEARHILLVVNGAHKADILSRALEGPVTGSLPATLLRHHPGLHIYADAAAASRLSASKTENT